MTEFMLVSRFQKVIHQTHGADCTTDRIHSFENVKVALQNHNIATIFNQFDILKQRVASLLMKAIFFMASDHTPQ